MIFRELEMTTPLSDGEGRLITAFNVYKYLNEDLYYNDISEKVRQEYLPYNYKVGKTERRVIELQKTEIKIMQEIIDRHGKIVDIWFGGDCLHIAVN